MLQHIQISLKVIVATIFLFLSPEIVKAQAPFIDKIEPLSGSVNSEVTISGTNLVYKTLPSLVYFGTIPATIKSQSATSITVNVPLGAAYEHITVANALDGSTTSEQFFLVEKASPCNFTNPAFDLPVTVSTLSATPTFVALQDMNSDRKTDLLVLTANSKLTIFSNNSTVSNPLFEKTAEISLIVTAIPTSLAVSDLNSDGFMDVVIGYNSGNRISILQGVNGTTFSTPINIVVGITPKINVVPRLVAIADLDNDGILDIITGNTNLTESVSVLKKSSISDFDYVAVTAIPKDKSSVTSIAIGDVDTDGNKEIIVADGLFGYYYMAKDGYKEPIQLTSTKTNLVTVGDFEKNGSTDIVLSIPGGLSVYTQGNSNLNPNVLFSGNATSLTTSNFNSDVHADIAALYVDAKTNENNIAFYTNTGSGAFEVEKKFIQTGIKGNINLAAGDVDRDGQADLVTFDPSAKTIYLYLKSSSIFINSSSISSNTPCESTPATVTAIANGGIVNWYNSNSSNKILLTTGETTTIPAEYITGKTIKVYVEAESKGCNTPLIAVDITIKPKPLITIDADPTVICPGSSVKVAASGGATSYLWLTSMDVKSTTSPSTIITPLNAVPINDPIKHIDTYTYTIQGTATNGCKNTSNVNIDVYSNQTKIISDKDKDANIICSGDKVLLTVNPNPSFDNGYTWSVSPSIYEIPSNKNPTEISPINPTQNTVAITYTIIGNSNGCSSSISKIINVKPTPTITPSSLLPVKAGQDFKQDFTVLNGATTTLYTITPTSPSTSLPSWFNFSGNTLQWPSGINNAGTYYFTITAKELLKCDALKNYKLIIEDLLDPKLIVNPIYKNVGDNAFLIKPSSTQSDGDIEYTLKTGASSSCAVIAPKGWVSKITCADSIPVMVTQFASGRHKQSQVEIFIKISPNPATLLALTTTGVSINDTDAKLKYLTNSDALQSTIEIIQLSNTDVAEIDPYGSIKPYKQGTVDIEIRVPPTSTYAALTKTFTITVYPNIQKPIIVNDTIRITVDQDTIVNILENDIGVTRAIAPSKTDIDMENDSLQNKYFSLSVGNFLIDANGNLDVKPFSGFIGEGKINYTVTDSAGRKSDVGYVVIQVAPLVVNPPLKANEVMTPNNDGLNDGLLIAYANLKSTSSLTIMDGVGNVVYETTNYQNDWRGINKKGDALEPGVYFYVYEEKESGRSLKQYIQIIK